MTKLIGLAWRNVWRNRRRSIITISAIAFAVLIATITRSLQYGTYDTMESIAVTLFNGEIQVHRTGFQEEQTFNYFLDEHEEDWQAVVAQSPQFDAVSKRLTGFGLVSTDSASIGSLIIGIEPEREAEVTQFSKMVRQGEQLQANDDHRVLAGVTLAKNLRAGVGDTIVVLTQGYRNQLGADTYAVKGLISTGSPEVDNGIMIMMLPDAQELFSLYDGITQVVYSIDDFRKAESRTKFLRQKFHSEDLEVLPWQKLMPELKQLILMDNVSGAIYLAFILIVVGFEIFNTTLMGVMERTREFGVLEAMGMKPRQVTGLVLWESLIKIALSVIAGLLLSILAIIYFMKNPIALSEQLQEAYASYGFSLDSLVFSARAIVFIEPLVAITLISVLALFFPIYRTRQLSPIDALRRP